MCPGCHSDPPSAMCMVGSGRLQELPVAGWQLPFALSEGIYARDWRVRGRFHLYYTLTYMHGKSEDDGILSKPEQWGLAVSGVAYFRGSSNRLVAFGCI